MLPPVAAPAQAAVSQPGDCHNSSLGTFAAASGGAWGCAGHGHAASVGNLLPTKPPVLKSSFSLYCTMLHLSHLSPPFRATMFNSVSTCALAARGLCSVAAAEPCSGVGLAGSCRPGSEGPRSKAGIFLSFKLAVLPLMELCQTFGYLTHSVSLYYGRHYKFLLWVFCSEDALS